MKRIAVGRRLVLRALVACILSTGSSTIAAAADAVFPIGSRIGLVPPPGLTASTAFSGFEDRNNGAFIRLVTLPGQAFDEIKQTLSNDALSKQGIAVEQREDLATAKGPAILLVARQSAQTMAIKKWLLIALIDGITAMVSFEMPDRPPHPYSDRVIRQTLASLTVRPTVPVEEQLSLVPFKVSELAGMRVVRVAPGVAIQLTDGPSDTLSAFEQPHMVISVSPGGPERIEERGNFARDVLRNLPPMKDVQIVSAEPMRVGGQAGYEVRAEGKSPQDGAELQIVQWLRFGTAGYLRIVGIAPKEKWAPTFTRFRAIRDGLDPK
jgi:hypothetical protein